MAALRWVLVALMAVIAAASVAYSLDLIAPGDASAEAALYYCPMHPQVVQDHAGECPICSMTLMPKPTDRDSVPAVPAEHGHTEHSHAPPPGPPRPTPPAPAR